MEFLADLKDRNEILFWFGVLNAICAIILLGMSFIKPIEFVGTNAWYKPIKFALSTAILSWSIAWYTGYLEGGIDINLCNYLLVITLAFEVIYIAYQAANGQASHYNISTSLYSALFSLMALAASIATLVVAYIGLKFFALSSITLPAYYLWAIRLGIVFFVIFSFQGFAMGGNMAHTVGAADGGKGIPFLNWSISHGDLRIAHFVGMHALQILPILAWYLLKDVKLVLVMAFLYACLAVFVLMQALRGSPLLS